MKTILTKGTNNIEPIVLTDNQVLHFLNVYRTTPSLIAKRYAKAKLIAANIKLVASIAKRYINRGIDFNDLIYEGVKGLNIAIDKYDINKKVKLATYAYMWILQTIQRSLGLYKEVYIPDDVCNLYGKITNVIDTYKQSHEGLNPSRQYIANTLNVSLKKVNNVIKACQTIYSLDRTMNDESDCSFIDTIADNTDMHKQLVLEDNKNQIDNELKHSLSNKEYYVLIHFYGLNDNDKLQLNEIATNLNLSVARIKQLKLQAINKLRSNNTLQTMYW